MKVKVLEIDDKGRLNLSRRDASSTWTGWCRRTTSARSAPAAGITATGTAAPDGTMTGDKHMTVFDGKIPLGFARRDFKGGLLVA